MIEKINRPDDIDYATSFHYETTGGSTIKELWIDDWGGFWMESNDGQKIIVPKELREIVANRIKKATFR